MKTQNQTWYVCEKCGESYAKEESAILCESRSITQERGVKVGDVVRVTAGDGVGHLAKVISLSVFSMNWGHYRWERYWHTVGLVANLLDYPGSRVLTFDNYETVK